MPDIPLEFRVKDYLTDQGIAVRSLRPFVTIQIGSVRPMCFLDTGAPFNIVSSSIARQIRWKVLGTKLLFQGKPVALDWQGVPCDFGETSAILLDPLGKVRSSPCRLAGKFAKARHPTLENYVLLGMNFLADNDVKLVTSSVQGALSGVVSVP